MGAITTAGMFNTLAGHYAAGAPVPYDYCVVDEAQDVSITQLRFLAAVGANHPNGLFFAGDLGQRIFQQPFSWKAVGVDVRGRSTTLKINYRTLPAQLPRRRVSLKNAKSVALRWLRVCHKAR